MNFPAGYNLPMTLTLDAATEKRIQQEIDLGHYSDVAEVVAHAVSLLAAQQPLAASRPHDPAMSPVDAVFGLWAGRHIDGLAYQEKLRAEW
jgi:Arc/MetJ-type ribon-helix-helix transcriptional regulator